MAETKLRFDGVSPFLADLAQQLSRYVLLGPSIEVVNIVAACTAFADGVLAWLIVRTSPDSTLRLVRLAAGTAAATAAVGIWQAFTGIGLRPDWRLNDPYITRINGTFSDPNALAAYLGVSAPLIAALAGRAAARVHVFGDGAGTDERNARDVLVFENAVDDVLATVDGVDDALR